MSARLSASDRREQLLRVALTTFARAGYHETSMNDIADAAGVVRQHFFGPVTATDLWAAVATARDQP